MTGRHLLPSELDVRDPNFARQCLSWAHEAHRDMEELIARTTATIEESSALLEHIDRLLCWRLGSDGRGERSRFRSGSYVKSNGRIAATFEYIEFQRHWHKTRAD